MPTVSVVLYNDLDCEMERIDLNDPTDKALSAAVAKMARENILAAGDTIRIIKQED